MRDKIILIGDIHGEFNRLRYELNRKKVENSYLIQVGDFGVGFHKPNYYRTMLGKLNESLQEHNNHLYAIRGNHDEPSYFESTNNPFNLSNITLVSDFTERTILGQHILFAGGAVSVDRIYRTLGESYWAGEPFKLKEDFEYHTPYDIVVTHSRPGCCGAFKGFNKIEEYIKEDPTLKEDLIKEASVIDEFYKLTKPTKWYYGHFHKSDVIEYGNTTFRCLDIDELYEHRS